MARKPNPNAALSESPSGRAPVVALKGVRLMDGQRPLFDGVDLAIEARSRACLVGRNGAGKSTLMRLLISLIEPDSGECVRERGLSLAYVPQEPEPRGARLMDWLTAEGVEPYLCAAELDGFGLNGDMNPATLSGGEKRRAALARAFAASPDVLLLDEPTNHLDIFAIEALEARLKSFRGAALIISHDRRFLDTVTHRCFWLHDRRVRVLDKGFSAFDDWAEAQITAESENLRRLEKAIERETDTFYRSITGRRTRNEGRAARLESMRAEAGQRRADQGKSLNMAVESGGMSGRRICELKSVSKAFGDKVLLKGFSTRILRGDRVAIVGPNGAGKSTLIKLILGQIPADTGEVILGTGLELAYLDQGRDALKGDETLWDVLANAGSDQVMVRGQPRHVAAYAKDFLFRDNQLRQPVRALSGGERNRLQLARALAKPANLLVLDEPTNDLDMDTLDLLEDLLADYDGTLILVSHDRDFIDRLASSTIGLNGRGQVVETPGGWVDFLDQNPEFFDNGSQSRITSKPLVLPSVPETTARPVRKLSYKDQRRLEEIEQGLPRAEAERARIEVALADPDLYGRDPDAFARLMSRLEAVRRDLETMELDWFNLEEKKTALNG